MASSVFICIDDQPIVENWMEVDSSTFTGNFHEACCLRDPVLSFSLFEAFVVASVVPLFEPFIEALSIPFASCYFAVFWRSHNGGSFLSLQNINVES
jgi:hypothetical protein